MLPTGNVLEATFSTTFPVVLLRFLRARFPHYFSRAIGPLPLRENTPRGGSNGTGSSPCWNHRLRVPLCTALTEGTYEAVDTKQPTADRVNGLDRRPFAKPLVGQYQFFQLLNGVSVFLN